LFLLIILPFSVLNVNILKFYRLRKEKKITPQFPPSEKIVVNPDSVSSRIGPLSSATGNAESAGNCCQYCDDEIDHVLQCYILHSVQILSG
jgi:hypothetical protein